MDECKDVKIQVTALGEIPLLIISKNYFQDIASPPIIRPIARAGNAGRPLTLAALPDKQFHGKGEARDDCDACREALVGRVTRHESG